MINDSDQSPYPAHASHRHGATVTNLATHRRNDDVLDTITFVFDGINYGTIRVRTPYVKDKPIILYLVPSRSDAIPADGVLGGPLDCLITDDPSLALEQPVAR